MATLERTDKYRSRVAPEPSITDRLDPVVRGTAGDGPLSQEQLDFFDKNGYLQFENLITPEEIAESFAEVERLANDPAWADSERTIIEPHSRAVRSLFAVHNEPGIFSRLARHPKIAGMAKQVLGSSVYIHQSRVNLKPGFAGERFPWHSDFETWHIEDGMPEMRALSISIALTENDEFNGPLLLVPGSHQKYVACVGETPDEHYKKSLRLQEYGTPDEDSLTKLISERGLVSAKGPAGSAVMFECNTMHGSAENITPFPRCNIFMVFNSMENTLGDPYGGTKPRPEIIASRDFTPVA